MGLGDFLAAVPALRAVVRALPDHQVLLGTPAALEPLVRLSGLAVDVVPVTGLEPPQWSRHHLAVAVNLHGSGPQSHRLLLDMRPEWLVAFECPALGVDGPAWDAEEHEAARWCRLASTALGVGADPVDLALGLPTVPPPVAGAVVIHPGAAFPARRWPPERFAAIARWSASRGWPVAVTGSDAEVDVAEEVRRLAGLPQESVLAGRTDLEALAALIASARLVICGDTGVAHLASAYATPSVVLFGPTPPSRWGPPATGPHAALWKGQAAGNPWADGVDPALLEITVEEVLEAAVATTPRSSC